MAPRPRTGRQPHGGFTIVEMLVTVVIVSILATVAIPMAQMASKRSKEQELRLALREIRAALDAYHEAGEDGRIRRQPDEAGYPPRLATLVEGVPAAQSKDRKQIYFLRRIPRDPFADAKLPAEQTWGKRSYESSAEEPREGADVYDVYSLSPAKGLNGIPYREW